MGILEALAYRGERQRCVGMLRGSLSGVAIMTSSGEHAGPPGSAEVAATVRANRSTVMVVDDNPGELAFLFEHLEKNGFRVLVARGGEEAVSSLDHVLPDVILLDVLMPEPNGYETCQDIKRLERARYIPIIFMSALQEPEHKVRAFAAGAVDYVTKPVHQDEILARIHRQVAMRMLQREQEARNVLLEQQSSELRQHNEILQAFGHMVVHDLRNGLSRILAYTGWMRCEASGDFSAQQVEDLQIIYQAGLDMAELIDALSILVGISQKHAVIEPVDMRHVLARVKLALADEIVRRRARLVEPDTWPVAAGYAPWIERVWQCYAQVGLAHGGAPPQLTFGAELLPDGKIRFFVRDNGPGIPDEQRAALFEPFAHVFDGMASGRGLDLTIAARMIGKLGGAVGCVPCPGGGSEFYFTLPAAAAT